MMLPETQVGDYVLVHAGYAIQRIDEHEAQETLRLFDELEALVKADETNSALNNGEQQ